MKRIVTGILLLLSALAAGAQTTQITASHIQYFGGSTVTGSFCVTPTDQSGIPINLVTPAGQQFSPLTPLCFPIVNGVLSASATVPDVSQTAPANACLKLTVYNTLNTQVASYPCIQPSSSTWSFDAYIPSSLPSIPALSLPQYQLNGTALSNQAVLNFVCPGCTYASGALTLPTGGALPNIANNTILGNTSGATAAAAALTVSVVQALLLPSPGAIGGTTPAPGSFSSLVDTALGSSTSPVCPNGTAGALTTTGCVTGNAPNENLSFSATPTFSTSFTNSRIVLSGNITSFTLGAGTDGQSKCLNFAHDGTSTAYTVTPPANVHGLMTVGSTASKNNVQCFKYFTSDSAWLAHDPGVVNQ